MPLLHIMADFDVANMPTENLIVLALIIFVLFGITFVNGFTIKLGEKEINIGGIKRNIERIEHDMQLKDEMKRHSDFIDHETIASLYDLADSIETNIINNMAKNHCIFTVEKFLNIIKSEIYKRIRRNNLRERLSDSKKIVYVEKIIRDIKDRYEIFYGKVMYTTKCGEKYDEFNEIRGELSTEINRFIDAAKKIIVQGVNQKIKYYETYKDKFKTPTMRKMCCDNVIEKNKKYIKGLT